jgi:hypothetical protein
MQSLSRLKVKLTLELDLVLNNKSLALVVNLLGELGGDGVVSGGVLYNKTLVAVNSLVLDGLLNCPLADVCPLLLRAGRVLLCVRGLPSLVPVVGELFKEVSLDVCRLSSDGLANNRPLGELISSLKII